MWKLIFNTETNQGVATNRAAEAGEFMQELPPSQCAWFMSTPERYRWTGTGIEERPEWEQEQEEAILERLKANNKRMAEALQEEALATIERNALRKSLGLPPLVLEADEEKLKAYTKVVQGDIDNPQAIEGYNPPLPPGVVPPAFDSITIEVKRVPGWQGNLGWRAVIKGKSPSFTPGNLALSVHTGADCTGYKYTTGAFQFDAQANEYFAICPPGQEPGNATEHFGLLYGAAQLSCFTLESGQESILVYAYN